MTNHTPSPVIASGGPRVRSARYHALGALALLLLPLGISHAQGSTPEAPTARDVVERMVAAHGGIDRWRALSTLRYDNVFFNPAGTGNPWWVTREMTHLASRHAFHEWPLDGATLGSDSREVWSRNWRQANPPGFMAYFFFRFLALPWLALEPSAQLGPVGTASLPGREGLYDTLRVTWDAPHLPGHSAADFFVLYVDRDSGLLHAYQYGIGYGAMLDLMGLPPDRTFFGPVLRIHDAFVTVGGLVFPARMHTGNLDGTRVAGHHALFNYALDEPWDPDLTRRPPDAVSDRSRPTRRGR